MKAASLSFTLALIGWIAARAGRRRLGAPYCVDGRRCPAHGVPQIHQLPDAHADDETGRGGGGNPAARVRRAGGHRPRKRRERDDARRPLARPRCGGRSAPAVRRAVRRGSARRPPRRASRRSSRASRREASRTARGTAAQAARCGCDGSCRQEHASVQTPASASSSRCRSSDSRLRIDTAFLPLDPSAQRCRRAASAASEWPGTGARAPSIRSAPSTR